jgi:predicted metal-dependent hydrolase
VRVQEQTAVLTVDGIPVEIRRSRRRKTRIGLAFDPSGVVILEAPMDATDEELASVIREHGRWLQHRLSTVQADATCIGTPRYTNGELLQYLGDAYELALEEGGARVLRQEKEPQLRLFHDVRGVVGTITVRVPEATPAHVQRVLKGWYADEARRLFGRSFERLAGLPWLVDWSGHWRTRFMRSQWGSCSTSGRIALNTHLVKVPERLIDYVVLHELCHLEHHDHSHRFYALMRSYMPDWEVRRQELDAYLPLLLHE